MTGLDEGEKIAGMATSKKRRFIQNQDKEASVVVSAGKHSNRLHIRVSLTRAQEDRLRKMLEQREKFRRREK